MDQIKENLAVAMQKIQNLQQNVQQNVQQNMQQIQEIMQSLQQSRAVIETQKNTEMQQIGELKDENEKLANKIAKLEKKRSCCNGKKKRYCGDCVDIS